MKLKIKELYPSDFEYVDQSKFRPLYEKINEIIRRTNANTVTTLKSLQKIIDLLLR